MITAHCLVKNEEKFIYYAIKSVIDYVDHVLIFDTGSADSTVQIIRNLVKEYPEKIVFEQKGNCDKTRHTLLRQEMVGRTTTDWFMILDGDEVWTGRGMQEAISTINNNYHLKSLIAPFYLCVGDIIHHRRGQGSYNILEKKGNFSPRFIKIDAKWRGEYGYDILQDNNGKDYVTQGSAIFLKNKYWHLSHLSRSRFDNDYSSGGIRFVKNVDTYFLLGKKIKESLPKVFDKKYVYEHSLSFYKSLMNFFFIILKKISIKFIGAKFTYKWWRSRHQFLKYFIVGMSGVILDIVTLYFFKETFALKPVWAVVLNQIIMVNYIFFLNKYWSFAAHGMGHRQMVRFLILTGFNYLFAVGWMFIFTEVWTVNYLLARVVNIIFAVGWNFLLYKFWVFKK